MSTQSHKHNLDVELDSRFPSGEYYGFFIQRGQKHRMTVMLTFRDGSIDGLGLDVVGLFNMRGSYILESGRVTLLKRYHGKHDVAYAGWAESAEGGIWGVWDIDEIRDRGGWHLWPRRFAEARSRCQTQAESEPHETAVAGPLATRQPG